MRLVLSGTFGGSVEDCSSFDTVSVTLVSDNLDSKGTSKESVCVQSGCWSSFAAFSLLDTAAETIWWPKCFTSYMAFRNSEPRKNSLNLQKGFWNRSPVAPEAKSNDLEKGNEAGMSIWQRIESVPCVSSNADIYAIAPVWLASLGELKRYIGEYSKKEEITNPHRTQHCP